MAGDHVDEILAAWARERPDLDASPMAVIGRISRAARILDRELGRVFEEHGLDGAGFDVLATLRRSGEPFLLSASALADATMVRRSSMTSRIDRLEQAGWVERVPDEDDGRGVGVRLTRAGRLVTDRAVAAHVENETRLLAPLPRGTVERLAKDLRQFLSALESPAQSE